MDDSEPKIDIRYVDKVMAAMIALPMDSVKEIEKRAPQEAKDRFIEALKFIISLRMDQNNGFVLEFNDDYTKFRKYELF